MKLRLIPAEYDYLNDVQDIPRAFAPFLEVNADSLNYLKWDCIYEGGFFRCTIDSDILGCAEASLEISDKDIAYYKKHTKRFLKNFLYDFLSDKLNKKLPYGSLTGVRPTKLFYELAQEVQNPEEYLSMEFNVTSDRARLISVCVANQKEFINNSLNNIALFVNIPFCPTRCSYCSFISTEINKVKKEIPLYVSCLIREIEGIKGIIKEHGLKVTSIYVGGGTPSSIGNEYLNLVLAPLRDYGVEFTVEAGRPDVIDDSLVKVLKKNNVTRVSVNPQTFKQATLDGIGRKHTIDEIYSAYEKVNGNFSVNMDLIAGLPDEKLEDFIDNLERTINLHPDNITVHTLSLKRGSIMTLDGNVKEADGHIKQMCDYSISRLAEVGYMPYYMYRQKNMADNLENVGYTISGAQCKYNIDMMEESISVIGVGAGAMSKNLNKDKIERLSNPKGFREYVDRISSIIESKRRFFGLG